MRKKRGSITIMASIIFLILLILSGTLIDAARLTLGYSKALRAFESSSRSVLGNYNSDLKDTYGLFAMDGNKTEISAHISDMTNYMINPLSFPYSSKDNFIKNIKTDLKLGSDELTKDIWKIWDYDVKQVDVTSTVNPIVDTKNQILEYVKYRAPLTIGEEFLEKLDVVIRSAKTAEVMESKVELDDSLGELDNVFMNLRKYIDGWGVSKVGDFSVVAVNSKLDVTKDSKFFKSLNFKSYKDPETKTEIKFNYSQAKYDYTTDLRLRNEEKNLVLSEIDKDYTMYYNQAMLTDLRSYIINKTKYEITEKILSHYEDLAMVDNPFYNRVIDAFSKYLSNQSSGNITYSYEETDSEGNTTTKQETREKKLTESQAKTLLLNYLSDDQFTLRLILQWPMTAESELSQMIKNQYIPDIQNISDRYTAIFNDSRSFGVGTEKSNSLKEFIEAIVDLAVVEARMMDRENVSSGYISDTEEVDNNEQVRLKSKLETLKSSLNGVLTKESTYKTNTSTFLDSYLNYLKLFEAQIRAYLELTKLIVGDVTTGDKATGGIYKQLADKSQVLKDNVVAAENSIKENEAEALADGIESTQWSVDYAKGYMGLYDMENNTSEFSKILRETEIKVIQMQQLLRKLLVRQVELESANNDAGINKMIYDDVAAVEVKTLEDNYIMFNNSNDLVILVLGTYLKLHEDIDDYYFEIINSYSIDVKLSEYDIENKNNETLTFEKSTTEATKKADLKTNATAESAKYTGETPNEPAGESIFTKSSYAKNTLPSDLFIGKNGNLEVEKSNEIDLASDKTAGKSALSGLSSISSLLAGYALTIRDNLYINEYILHNFKNRLTEKTNAMDFQGLELHERKTALNMEVEYIVNGIKSETEIKDFNNDFIMSSKIYGIRFAMNFLHVMITPEKQAVTLSMATAIAGWWTFGLGIPIVQVGIAALWAALESSVDIVMLHGGYEVAFYKLNADWYTFFPGVAKLGEPLLDAVIDPIAKEISIQIDKTIEKIDETAKAQISKLKNEINAVINNALSKIEGTEAEINKLRTELQDQALSYLNDSVKDLIAKRDLINSQISHMIMLELEKQLTQDATRKSTITEQITLIRTSINDLDNSINSVEIEKVVVAQCALAISGITQDELKNRDIVTLVAEKFANVNTSVLNSDVIKQQLEVFMSKLEATLSEKVSEYSTKLNDKIQESLESSVNTGKEKIISYLKNDIFTFTQKNRLKKAFDVDIDGKKIGKDIKSSPIRFSYEDYLRLFLLLTNENKKIARTMDIIQINTSIREKDFAFSNMLMSFKVDMKIEAKSIFRTVLLIPGFNLKNGENTNATFNLSTGVSY